MKNILTTVIILPLMFFLVIPVLAQNDGPTDTQVRKTEMTQETVQSNIQEQTATRTARLTETKKKYY